jgi:hypothetical protein
MFMLTSMNEIPRRMTNTFVEDICFQQLLVVCDSYALMLIIDIRDEYMSGKGNQLSRADVED